MTLAKFCILHPASVPSYRPTANPRGSSISTGFRISYLGAAPRLTLHPSIRGRCQPVNWLVKYRIFAGEMPDTPATLELNRVLLTQEFQACDLFVLASCLHRGILLLRRLTGSLYSNYSTTPCYILRYPKYAYIRY